MIKTERSQWTLLTEKDLLDVHKLQSIPEVERFNTLGLPKDFEDEFAFSWVEAIMGAGIFPDDARKNG